MQMGQSTKLFVVSVLVAVLAVSIALYIMYFLVEPATDEVLSFLEEVVGIDVQKYDITAFNSSSSYPSWLGGLEQLTGKYSLESETNNLEVLFKFRNASLSWCLVRNIVGQIHYSEPPSADIYVVVYDFLQRYQSYTHDSDVEELKNMLISVGVTENSTTMKDNMRLIVTVTSFSSSLDWRYTSNGTEYSRLSVSFRDGNFYSVSINKSLY